MMLHVAAKVNPEQTEVTALEHQSGPSGGQPEPTRAEQQRGRIVDHGVRADQDLGGRL